MNLLFYQLNEICIAQKWYFAYLKVFLLKSNDLMLFLINSNPVNFLLIFILFISLIIKAKVIILPIYMHGHQLFVVVMMVLAIIAQARELNVKGLKIVDKQGR